MNDNAINSDKTYIHTRKRYHSNLIFYCLFVKINYLTDKGNKNATNKQNK